MVASVGIPQLPYSQIFTLLPCNHPSTRGGVDFTAAITGVLVAELIPRHLRLSVSEIRIELHDDIFHDSQKEH